MPKSTIKVKEEIIAEVKDLYSTLRKDAKELDVDRRTTLNQILFPSIDADVGKIEGQYRLVAFFDDALGGWEGLLCSDPPSPPHGSSALKNRYLIIVISSLNRQVCS